MTPRLCKFLWPPLPHPFLPPHQGMAMLILPCTLRRYCPDSTIRPNSCHISKDFKARAMKSSVAVAIYSFSKRLESSQGVLPLICHHKPPRCRPSNQTGRYRRKQRLSSKRFRRNQHQHHQHLQAAQRSAGEKMSSVVLESRGLKRKPNRNPTLAARNLLKGRGIGSREVFDVCFSLPSQLLVQRTPLERLQNPLAHNNSRCMRQGTAGRQALGLGSTAQRARDEIGIFEQGEPLVEPFML